MCKVFKFIFKLIRVRAAEGHGPRLNTSCHLRRLRYV